MKRGASGLSLVVGVDKPEGLSSHDVVNRCRRIFGERRVGHTGTLDPLATGAMLVCVGPATRLDAYFVDHDKRYRVRIAFGVGTDTDDALGEPTSRGAVPPELFDPAFAGEFVSGLVGKAKQLPPVYSALKVGGKKACDEARAGRIIDLAPREIEIYEAKLARVVEGGDGELSGPSASCPVFWDVDLHVSKGTYIRSIARDAGRTLGCPAHVAALRRTAVGSLSLADCVSLETLEDIGVRAAIDPIGLLGIRFAYADGALEARIANGGRVCREEWELCERRYSDERSRMCACTSGVCGSTLPPSDGELVAVVSENKLAAIYAYAEPRRAFEARCVFQKGVSRGECL